MTERGRNAHLSQRLAGRLSGRLAGLAPWRERDGRLSPLRLAVFVAVLASAGWLAWLAVTGGLGTKPVTQAIHQSGDWAIRLLLVTLLITPLRRISGWNKVIGLRRMLGLSAAAYAFLHLGLYVVDQGFDLVQVASEIVKRIYLAIGFVAVAGLLALALTSTDAAIRRMGPGWHRLHRLVYPVAVLAAVHFFLQSKSDVSEATLMAGFFVALMLLRAAKRFGLQITSPLVLAGLAIVAGLATAGLEYLWYALATGIPAERVLAANLDFRYQIRPAWWVAAAVLALVPVSLLGRQTRAPGRGSGQGRGRPQARPARAAARP